MPEVPYVWNESQVDILLEGEAKDSDPVVREKNITGFFKGIGVEGLSSGNVSKIIQAGYTNIPEILKMTKHDFLKVPSFKEKTADKLYSNIQSRLHSPCVTLVQVMAATNLFGRGFSEKKLETIMNEYPEVLESSESDAIKVEKVEAIKGMAKKTAEAFVSRIPAFNAFIQESKIQKKESIQESKIHPLFNKTVVFTGIRDKDLENQLKTVNAKLGASVSKNTSVLIVKETTSIPTTGKLKDAQQYNVPILTLEEFKQKYF